MDRFKIYLWLFDDWGRWDDDVEAFAEIKLPFLPRVNDTFNYKMKDYEVLEVNYGITNEGKIDKQGIDIIVMQYSLDKCINPSLN